MDALLAIFLVVATLVLLELGWLLAFRIKDQYTGRRQRRILKEIDESADVFPTYRE